MKFEDRVSAYPNRYTVTDENGNVYYAIIERADEPVNPGTPLSAETFNSLLLCSESADHPGCYCRTVDGETEWLNPPMADGVVYRTTERYNGKPVYVKKLAPILAVKGGGTYDHGEENINPIRCTGAVVSPTYTATLPISMTSNLYDDFIFVNVCVYGPKIMFNAQNIDFNINTYCHVTMWFVRG